jgi:hypothetical protein
MTILLPILYQAELAHLANPTSDKPHKTSSKNLIVCEIIVPINTIRMERIAPSRIPETKQHAYVRSHYQPGEFSELRQRILKEKRNDKAAFLIGKLTKHSVIVRKSTTFLIIFSIVALYAAMYLIHLESVERHLQSHEYKTAVR